MLRPRHNIFPGVELRDRLVEIVATLSADLKRGCPYRPYTMLIKARTGRLMEKPMETTQGFEIRVTTWTATKERFRALCIKALEELDAGDRKLRAI